MSHDHSQDKRKLEQSLAKLPGDDCGGVSRQRIDEMEDELDVNFPLEYREFLERFGCVDLGVRGDEVQDSSGYVRQASVVEETLSLRKIYGDLFPGNVVVVGDDQGGNYECLVCDGEDEGKIVFWQHDVYTKLRYPNYPEGKPDFWIHNKCFWEWVSKEVDLWRELHSGTAS